MMAMDSDRANRVGHRIAEIVHVDPDRDPGAPFADRLEDRQAVTRLARSRMSKPSTLGGAHSVTVIVPSDGSPKRELRRRATEPRPSEPSAFSSMWGSPTPSHQDPAVTARYLHPDVQAMLDAGTAFSAWWSVAGPERPPLGFIEGGKSVG